MTKAECIAAFEPTKQEVILIELDQSSDVLKQIKTEDGKVINLYQSERHRDRQNAQAESGRIVKMYVLGEGEEPESSLMLKFQVGDRVTFMDYVCPRGPFQKFPELRVMSLNEIIGKLHTEESIVE